MDLAREDGEALKPVDLRALDLAIPIGALHQPHHQPVPAPACKIDQPVDHEGAALLIGLHHEADAVPAREFGLEAEPLQQVERDFQPVGFLRVDVEADVERARQQRQFLQSRIELALDARELRAAVARMERREFDRDAGPVLHAPAVRCRADRADRVLVIGEVAGGLACRYRRLAQHIVGIAEALGLVRLAVGEGLLDRLAGHELLAHQAHRAIDAVADQRLAAARDQPRQGRRQPALAVGRGEAAGHQQAPGGGIHEQRRAATEMRLPVAAADLVSDQRVARRVVGNAQQRFGEAHQRHALLARQGIFVDQPFDAATGPLGPQDLDQPPRQPVGRGLRRLGQGRRRDEWRHALGLGTAIG